MKITDRYGTVLRCYDNGGRSFDRYTILPPRWAVEYKAGRLAGGGMLWAATASGARPFHPQGFGQYVAAVAGPQLGRGDAVTGIYNALAWYMLEEVCYSYVDLLD